ncbi:hypothetical protein EJ357_39465 [Streptomyces cyaneochromogenes]|uniref:Uncharacterized protein n=1 Tax=Streptomyces cyaneochromogenes TaxID=2496836 RepID=A0A3Q9EXW9_9ACTN|nr:hypothetical protein [Streptomyces cyaneochromogenes]AZQ38778.1 hypothetical protein EJ357_39465 [Streptomyces cyaneochromogenes]
MPVLRAAAAVADPPHQPYHDDPSIVGFFKDLVEPFGATVDEQRLRDGANVSHRDLVDRLFAEVGSDERADLVVVSHALPDVHPFTAVASHLNMLLGGAAKSFCISEQGLAAPFTALRIISALQRAGRAERSVLAVLEQTTLPTPHPLVDSGELTDSGVLLVLGGGDGLGVSAVESHASPEATTARLAELAADPTGVLLVLGPGARDMADAPAGVKVHHAGDGSYCTSVWLELARHWQEWRRDHSAVILCDVDPLVREGHMAVLRPVGAPLPAR